MEKLLSAQQVADFLGMHPKTLYKRLRENRIALSFVRLSERSIAFRPKDVEMYVSTREVVRTGDGPKKKQESAFAKLKRKYPDYEIMSSEQAQEFFANVKVLDSATDDMGDDDEEGRVWLLK